MIQQAFFLLNKNPDLCSRYSLKISLKQMGDPVLNSKNVLKALRQFARTLPGAMQVVSTSAPKNNGDFFKDLQTIQDRGANIRLQFSCHTTSDTERAYLSPKTQMMSLSEIGKAANEWRGQKVTLNFVMFEGYTYEVAKLEKIFSPEKVFIKLNYIDHNELTQESGFRDAAISIKNDFSEELKKAGYQLAHRNA
jgi:adenine C2-methylase RlmN of 23S rRNA A2503 and tRNA A37